MNRGSMPNIWVPLVAALAGGVLAILAAQFEVFSKHQTDIEKLNEELFLRKRVKAYTDFMNNPSEAGRNALVLVGSNNVVIAMGTLYSKFCQKQIDKDGKKVKICENTCQENYAFIKVYQAMRKEFKLTRMSPVSDRDLYLAKYESEPECSNETPSQ